MPAKSARTSPSADAARLYFSLFLEIGIISQLSGNRFQRVMPFGLTMAQFSLLTHCLRLGDGWTPARLAAAFQVTRGTMTNTLQKLEAKGFIRVDPDPEDARSKRVFLTPAGRAAQETALKALVPALAELPEGFPPELAAEILPALERLRNWLDTHR
ncbi:MarR family transcriptional regulator [Hyphomonas sp.]|jgi:DNA-binding MarR family transcriptional regulator|uniref:MarR family winged helix-turn-helix transcriptional regulator n=1 Tax=Hyphomonas sp. TaxID=87 RepID=UPI0025BF03FF|nr:MarR family transcriptional regulator [Hyphomonas sp.]